MKFGISMFAAAVALAGLTATAGAQDWPTRNITLIVPFAPGGGIDASARLQALVLGELSVRPS